MQTYIKLLGIEIYYIRILGIVFNYLVMRTLKFFRRSEVRVLELEFLNYEVWIMKYELRIKS
jgi:hypothetical protein